MKRIGRWASGVALIGVLLSVPGCKGCREAKRKEVAPSRKAIPAPPPTAAPPPVGTPGKKTKAIRKDATSGVRISKTPSSSQPEVK